jgi:PadR family transcriptional regulator PadR
MTVSEGSVYPMLKRLQTDGYFETYLKESPNGPARKYYRITISGKQRQAMLLKQWTEFTNQVNSFFEGV